MPVKGFQIDASITDLNDISTLGSPAPANGDLLVYNSSSSQWEHKSPDAVGGVAEAFFIDLDVGVGSPPAIVENSLPVGWSTSYNATGDFVILHSLSSTSLGYALSVQWVATGSPPAAPGSKILNIGSFATGSTQFKIETSTGAPINGRVVGMIFK